MAVDEFSGEGAFRIRFEDMSPADANRAAAELRDMIQDASDEELQTDITKESTETQDFGATLIVILGTKAAVWVAKAIHDYVAKRGDRVVIETGDGKVIATGAAAANIDVNATVAAMKSAIDG